MYFRPSLFFSRLRFSVVHTWIYRTVYLNWYLSNEQNGIYIGARYTAFLTELGLCCTVMHQSVTLQSIKVTNMSQIIVCILVCYNLIILSQIRQSDHA